MATRLALSSEDAARFINLIESQYARSEFQRELAREQIKKLELDTPSANV